MNNTTPAVQKDTSISMTRFVAMLMIVSCHFMQYLSCELAWWFNIGVQIFLCISGYLYAGKRIQPIPFLKHSFSKILISFYVVMIPVSIILFLCDQISHIEAIQALLLYSPVPGGGHMWFIPTILCCYCITPFLQDFYGTVTDRKSLVKKTLVLLAIVFLVFQLFIKAFNPALISCYIAGYALRRLGDLSKKEVCLLLALAGGAAGARILFSYFIDLPLPLYFENYAFLISTPVIKAYFNAMLGIGLFLLLKRLFRQIRPCRLLELSDRYSYEVYLVHQFLILGPLSMMEAFESTTVNILVIVLLIIPLAVIAKLISEKIRRSLQAARRCK